MPVATQVRQFLPSFLTGFSVRMEAQKLGGARTLASRKAGAVCISRGAQRMEKHTLLSLNTRAAPQPGENGLCCPSFGSTGAQNMGWRLDVVVYTFNSSIQKAEAGRSLVSSNTARAM